MLFATPTGKAADVITKMTGQKAYTIHSVLMSYQMSKTSDNRFKFEDTIVMAVDEASMVSLEVTLSVDLSHSCRKINVCYFISSAIFPTTPNNARQLSFDESRSSRRYGPASQHRSGIALL